MYQKAKKLLAALCMVALVIMALPAMPVKAVTTIEKVSFQKAYAYLYENGAAKGKYTYTLTNLTPGQTIKWSVSGAGKEYVSIKNATTIVTKTSASNTITVKTGGKNEAKNKKVKLTAKIYSATGALSNTVLTTAKIKINPKKVSMTLPEEAAEGLFVGKSYKFKYALTPVNATCSKVWTVTDADGVDCSSYISKAGVFRPMKAGKYTVTLSAKIGTTTVKTASKSVEVFDYMISVQQTAADKIDVIYSGDVKGIVEPEDFSITNLAGANIEPKNFQFSEDGKTISITMYSNFKDGVYYSVDDTVTESGFQASVGLPASMKILTEKVTVGKETAIKYALYDQKGVDVTSVYNSGTIEYKAEATNGYLVPGTNKLLMMQVRNTAIVTATYNGKTDNAKLDDTAVITCVAAETSDVTNFTLTNATTAPDYTMNSYKDNRKVSIGSTYYAHFRALDTDESEIAYTSVTYESSNPDTLIISKTGKVTPIQSGTVKVIVTAVYAGEEYTYIYDVTIAEAPYLKSIQLSKSSVSMSNGAYSADYRQYISVTALDQYGENFPLTNEIANIGDNNLIKRNTATYDAASDRIVLNASGATPGTYNYTLSLTCGGEKASADFSVVICVPPSTGTLTHEIEIDKQTDDLSLNTDVNGNKFVTVRLAQYRGGVFLRYTSFTSATITKGSKYYSGDLTTGGSTAKPTISPAYSLSLKTLDINSGVCRKAELGTYTISLQYYSNESKSYETLSTTLKLTDTQDEPKIAVDRTTATKSCANALELAKNCLTPESGTITECVVTGTTQPGSQVVLKSGDQVNIKSVTLVNTYTISGGQSVTVTFTIAVGKTLTNI